MENQLNILEYYLNGVVFLISLYVTAFGLINIKKIGSYSIFLILSTSTFVQILITGKIKLSYTKEIGIIYNNYVLNFYLIIELIVLSYFFYKKIQSKKFKKIFLLSIIPLTILLLLTYILDNNIITQNYSKITAVESILILLSCIIVFVQILTDEFNTNLIYSSEFLTTAGIFFLFSFTCPFIMVYNYIQNKDDILRTCFYLVNYIGYIFFYTSIIFAFKCKIHLIKS